MVIIIVVCAHPCLKTYHTVNDLIQSPGTIKKLKTGEEFQFLPCTSALDVEITCNYQKHQQIVSTVHMVAPQQFQSHIHVLLSHLGGGILFDTGFY